MNYTLIPTLERLALTRIAVTLWNQNDIKDLIINSCVPLLRSQRSGILQEIKEKWLKTEKDNKKSIDVRRKWNEMVEELEHIVEKWQEVEEKVKEKLLQFSHPKSLKEKILNVIKPIGLQILLWMKYHNSSYLGMVLPNEFCWSPQGTIDEKKTAEALIKDENLDVTKRYKLACINCLEEDIPELWKKIPKSRKHLFYRKRNPRDVDQQVLVVLWTYDIRGEVDKLRVTIHNRHFGCTPYQYAFEFAVDIGNRVAAGYFLQKLTSAERKESLERCAGRGEMFIPIHLHNYFPMRNYPEVLCFLFSQLNEEQQLKMFEKSSCGVLRCLLEWPWQNFFMETVKHMWGLLEGYSFGWLLSVVVTKITDGFKDYNYEYFFRELCQQNSLSHSKYEIDNTCHVSMLSTLFQAKDKEKIKLTLENASTSYKERFIFSEKGRRICKNLIYDDESDLLTLFVRECIPSKVKAIQFKEEFKKQVHLSSEREIYVWSKLLKLLDDHIEKANEEIDKEEENNRPAKRLCTLAGTQLPK